MAKAAFREFGLPNWLRSDNGPPFASPGAGGLTKLAVKVIKAGVLPQRIKPGKPQQNGRHERLHLTLLQDTANPPARSLRQSSSASKPFNKCTMTSDRTKRSGMLRQLITTICRRGVGTAFCVSLNMALKMR